MHLRNVYSNGTNLYLCERSNICMVDIDLSNANIECFVLIHIDHLERYALRAARALEKVFCAPVLTRGDNRYEKNIARPFPTLWQRSGTGRKVAYPPLYNPM